MHQVPVALTANLGLLSTCRKFRRIFCACSRQLSDSPNSTALRFPASAFAVLNRLRPHAMRGKQVRRLTYRRGIDYHPQYIGEPNEQLRDCSRFISAVAFIFIILCLSYDVLNANGSSLHCNIFISGKIRIATRHLY